jgi:hypothetical protein
MVYPNRSIVLVTIVAGLLPPSLEGLNLQSCAGAPSTFATAWTQFANALVIRRPTEVQNLVDLRLQINSLRSKKQDLVGRIRTIIDLNDTPGWLQTRLDLDALSNDIDSALQLIDNTARQAGWLAGSPLLGDLLTSLRSRKTATICELARIPFPLSASDKQRLADLLQKLDQENVALGVFDKQLGELIRKAANR